MNGFQQGLQEIADRINTIITLYFIALAVVIVLQIYLINKLKDIESKIKSEADDLAAFQRELTDMKRRQRLTH